MSAPFMVDAMTTVIGVEAVQKPRVLSAVREDGG